MPTSCSSPRVALGNAHGFAGPFQAAACRWPLTEAAGAIDYDVTAAPCWRNAWLSDGANEVSGERISYDLRREYVTADAEKGGQVRMKINPPPRDKKNGSAP
jgi:hypothetical protein